VYCGLDGHSAAPVPKNAGTCTDCDRRAFWPDIIDEAGRRRLPVSASPLTCEAEEGVCRHVLWFRRDLARGTLVNQGEAVGIIAAPARIRE